LVPAIDGGDDFIWVGGPDEGLGFVVGLGDEAVDGGLEFGDGAEDAAFEAAPGELGEEALDGIEPGAGSRGEVEDEARMAGESGLDLRMLVGGVVVDDDMDDLAGGDLGFDGVEKADELLMPTRSP
jgi:hypothetical protein